MVIPCRVTGMINPAPSFIISALSKVPQPVGPKRAVGQRKLGNFDAFGWHNHCGNILEVRALFFETGVIEQVTVLILGGSR